MSRSNTFNPPALCEWFALCRRPAAGTVAHPVLGSVPTCADCATRMELVFEPEVQ